MKCKIICSSKDYVPTFEDFEKLQEFEYDGVFEFLGKFNQTPDNKCWVLDCQIGKLYVRHSSLPTFENNVFWEFGTVNGFPKETDEQDCCDECLLDDQEITKDLMLDEVISSQHREIERLMNIVQDLVTTNLKLVEIMGLKK